MSAATGIDCRDWEPDLFEALEEEVAAREDRWTIERELLAINADRLGVLASGMHYEEPRERIRRPGEEEDQDVAVMSPSAFVGFLMAGG